MQEGWSAGVHESSSFLLLPPLLLLCPFFFFFFFYFLRSRSWLEQREVRVFVTGDNSLAGELQHRRCNPHGRHGAQSNLISRWITETDRLDAID